MSKRKGLTIGKTRSALYTTAKVLGYVNAVKRGTLGKRVVRHIAGRQTAKILSRFF